MTCIFVSISLRAASRGKSPAEPERRRSMAWDSLSLQKLIVAKNRDAGSVGRRPCFCCDNGSAFDVVRKLGFEYHNVLNGGTKIPNSGFFDRDSGQTAAILGDFSGEAVFRAGSARYNEERMVVVNRLLNTRLPPKDADSEQKPQSHDRFLLVDFG